VNANLDGMAQSTAREEDKKAAENRAKEQKEQDEENSEEKPILPFSSMFIFSQTNM
jgi:ribosomal protein L12E/L44/L45/RPP1/RPP2